MTLNVACLIAWGIQMGLDLAVYPIIKVCINYALIGCAKGSKGSSKAMFDVLIDEHIAEVY